MMTKRTATLATSVCLITGAVHAVPLAVTNYDFESASTADGVIAAGSPAGWTFTQSNGNPGIFNPNGGAQLHYGSDALDTGSTGGQVGMMSGPTFGFIFTSSNGTGEAKQTMVSTLAANTTYTITVAIGTRNYFNNAQVPSDFRIALETTGGTIVAQFTGDVINGNPLAASENATGSITPIENSFVDYSASATTAASAPLGEGEQLIIRIQALADGRYIDFDNVRVDATSGFAPADLDQDGDVDDADFGIAFAAFSGPGNPTGNAAADLDQDGDVDDADFGLAFAAFTGPGGAAAVPEPASLALLGLGSLLVVRRRRA